ncbi:MAG: hypothetical protein M1830_009602 [Pleopsidium flavum]|nr:MAG: hypothetical protein M1830_009602 [Pleopsidium flavum]
MTAATQSFMSSDMLSTPGFFTAAISADENTNPFETSFKAGNVSLERSNDHRHRPHEQQSQDFSSFSNNDFLRSMKGEPSSQLFTFSPRVSPGPYDQQRTAPSNSAIGPSWGGLKQDHQNQFGLQPSVQLQTPSPPQSANHSPEQWQFHDISQPSLSPLHQLLTQNHQSRTRAEYGQVTPPDDRIPKDFDDQLEEHERQTRDGLASTGAGKRKCGAQSPQSFGDTNCNPSKRQRKSNSRSKSQSFDANSTSNGPPEDAKRSKFLERNRVAASKCRQKKKEWTSNLEVRARDLQNSKNQLAVVVASLKEEVLFLKGELLKHSTCGCTRIREYLNREVASMSQPGYGMGTLESKASPHGIGSDSRNPSLSEGTGMSEEMISENDEVATPSALDEAKLKPVSTGLTRETSPQLDIKAENKLEALLTAQLNQDTSDEAIAALE